MTTTENYQKHLQEVPFGAMPRTFQDAVTVTRELGFRYLWIDSLCIIQDSREDWAQECGRMQQVYELAAVTISAACADGPEAGFLRSRHFAPSACVPFPDSSNRHRIAEDLCIDTYIIDSERAVIKDSPLGRRGWIVQERFLSPRTLYYGDEYLHFICRSEEYFEHRWQKTRLDIPRYISDIYGTDPTAADEENQLYQDWQDLIIYFSKTELSVVTDKLPAISGLAMKFSKRLNDTYVAGFWRGFIVNSLLWDVLHEGQPISREGRNELGVDQVKRPYTAPSWSWASQDQAIGSTTPFRVLHSGCPTVTVEVEDIRIDLATSNPFGEVRSGELVLSGPVLSMRAEQVSTAKIDLFVGRRGPIAWFEPDPWWIEEYEFTEYVLCLMVFMNDLDSSGPKSFWDGLAISPVANLPDTYRRAGVANSIDSHFNRDRSRKDLRNCWRGTEIRRVTLI